MKLSRGVTAFAVVALLLTGSRAFAQASGSDSGDKAEGDKAEGDKAQGDKVEPSSANAEETKAPEAADAKETAAKPAAAKPTEPAQGEAPSSANPYQPFAPTPGPLRLESTGVSMQFGILLQPQFEVAGAPDADLTTKNLFVRRTRFMVGGTVLKYFEYFLELDYPNLFKLDPTETTAGTGKNAGGLNVQDAFVTVAPWGDMIKADVGFMLPAGPYNSLQSAGKLFGVDYFANTFRRNVSTNADPFRSSQQSPVGRDAGVQLRGLLLGGHLELRFGAFQGLRAGPVPAAAPKPARVGGFNITRFAGRLQVNILDGQPGFFYSGTTLGQKKVIAIGAFGDWQADTATSGKPRHDYKYYGVDATVDLPLGPGILNAQGGYSFWDGGTLLNTVPAYVMAGELGYLIGPVKLSPFVRAEHMVAVNPSNAAPSEDRFGAGLAFWPFGHTSNLKAFFSYNKRDPAPHAFTQTNVQWQLYFY